MVEQLKEIAAISAGFGGFGFGVAAVLNAWYGGKARLIRAERGDPELPGWRTALPGLYRSVLRNGRIGDASRN